MPEIYSPFANEICREFLVDGKPEEIRHLCREYRHGDTGRKPYYDRIGDKLNDRPQTEYSHHDEYHAGHERRYRQSGESVEGDNVIDDYDEGSRRTADLDGIAPQSRYEKSADDSRNKSDRRIDAAGNSECYGKRKSYDAHYNPGDQICLKL